ncbi:penicillin-binding protein activator LpoB [Alkalimarinus coralli]|uniref:penicillin-binding protein activator LpoB n=1 Tax=Alkalimarinus coralli TaxID=2935863 RepID=UPI00202B0522|nr:penicillin-binding protein activator LpoB [Alkalimarinus coralli]
MKLVQFFAVIMAALILASCSSGPKIQYGDATAVETTTIGFGSTDLQSIAAKLVDDLISFPPIVQMTSSRRPVVFVDKIKNKTTEHIDTESITDTVQTKLLQSGKFRFVDMTAVKAIQEQMKFQTESGMVDPGKAAAFGKQTGAEFMLYGNMSSIVKRNSGAQDVYYKFTLKLVNLESGIMEWAGEKEIRKTGEKSFMSL